MMLAAVLVAVGAARADVFNLGPGLTSLEFVPVGNPGNVGELSGVRAGRRVCGAVNYEYQIGKFEVTAGQYAEFLNAVARTDTYGLYNTNMWRHAGGCKIQRTGAAGAYAYTVSEDRANRPVNWVSWGDAARFVNWLTNGQPTGVQNATTTEDGSYQLNGAKTNAALSAVVREEDARYVIPTEDEWYKAAYYDPDKPGGAGYWDYATDSNIAPSNKLVAPDAGNNANFRQRSYSLGKPYYYSEVGDFENSESPYGTFDQDGNIWEWNEWTSRNLRGIRGGAFNSPVGQLSAAARYAAGPVAESYLYGFRICDLTPPGTNIPEPTTLGLLALGGGLSLIRLRRNRN
jgi:sulfatase modifying factor 1